MEENLKNDKQTEDRLPDLPVNMDQAEDAKGGSVTLNYTKVATNNIAMGSANDH